MYVYTYLYTFLHLYMWMFAFVYMHDNVYPIYTYSCTNTLIHMLEYTYIVCTLPEIVQYVTALSPKYFNN